MRNKRAKSPKAGRAPAADAQVGRPSSRLERKQRSNQEVANPPANAQEVESGIGRASTQLTPAKGVVRSAIGSFFKRRSGELEHLGSPVIAGAVATCFYVLLDKVRPINGHSRSEDFIVASLKHVHADLLLLGLFLLALCFALIGAPLARLLRKLLVLPLVQLGHHVFLVGAGAALVTLALAAADGADPRTIALLANGVLLLLVGGVEMQVAVHVCGLSDEKLTEHLPLPVLVAVSVAATIGFAWLLFKQVTVGVH